MHWKRPLALVGVAALAALAACGGGSDDNSGAPRATYKTVGQVGSDQDPSRTDGPAPAIDGAQQGGTVTVMSAGGLTTMDPTEAYYTNTASILSGLLIRSLTQYVYDPQKKSMVLIPDLATDLGATNDDYTTWVFTLRDGIKFEDGTPVTLDDWVYAINRSFDRKTFPTGADYSNQYFVNGDKYKGVYSDKDASGEGCGCVTANEDDNSITITMSKPFPDMPYWGAFPAMSPIPADKASDPAQYALHPVATGPYMIKDYEPGESLDVVKNPNWDANSDPGRHQYVDEYKMTFADQSEVIDQTILADQGDGQTTLTYDNVLQPDLSQAQDSGRMIVGGQPCTFFWSIDYRKVTDINIRKAIGYAYPYKDAWLAGGEIIGLTRIGGTMIEPPGIPGRIDPPYDILGNNGDTADPQKAKQLLQDAGQLGYKIKFLYEADSQTSVAAKDQIVKGLEAAGFDPQPVAAANVNQYVKLRGDPNTDINIRSNGWCSDWPSGSSWEPPLFQTGSGSNYAQFSEQAVDDKIQSILQAPLEDQPDMWGALDQEIMTKYYPAVVVGYGGVAMLHGSAIQNMVNDDVFGMPEWKDIWVQQ
jgi:peptide/nickel transport system substrate-binding protein